MKIFVFSDNIKIFKPIYKILSKYNLNIKYFCSIESKFMKDKFPFIKPLDINSINLLNFDIGFSIHSKQIFPKQLVKNVLCINLHPGYLPYNKGIYPHIFSIINKLPTGATLHIMDENIDSGNVIEQVEIQIEEKDTSLSLYNKILTKEVNIFKRNIRSILNNSFSLKTPKKYNSYNSKADFEKLCKINMNEITTMKDAISYLRALSHPPYSNAYFLDEKGNKIFVTIRLESTITGGSSLKDKYGLYCA